jgi:hypothetical protein
MNIATPLLAQTTAPAVGLTTAGMILMILCITVVLSLNVFCLGWIIVGDAGKRAEEKPQR